MMIDFPAVNGKTWIFCFDVLREAMLLLDGVVIRVQA